MSLAAKRGRAEDANLANLTRLAYHAEQKVFSDVLKRLEGPHDGNA